jgi:hypothetical protein
MKINCWQIMSLAAVAASVVALWLPSRALAAVDCNSLCRMKLEYRACADNQSDRFFLTDCRVCYGNQGSHCEANYGYTLGKNTCNASDDSQDINTWTIFERGTDVCICGGIVTQIETKDSRGAVIFVWTGIRFRCKAP